MLNLICAIFSGLIVGALARFFYPGAISMGWGMTILLGIAGSLLAGLVTTYSQHRDLRRAYNTAGWISSILGAMVLIFIGRHLGWHW